MLEDTVVNRTTAELAVSRGEKLLDIAQCEYAPGRACDYRSFELKCGHSQDVKLCHYRTGSYSCKICFQQEIHDVATSRGLKLVSMDIVKHCNDRMYVRECGHTEVHSHTYLKNRQPLPCQICLNKQAENNSAGKNFEVVKKIRNGYLVRCKTCDSEYTASTSVGRTGTPFCQVCFENELHKDAAACGFTYLQGKEVFKSKTETRDIIYRPYSCNTCGYEDFFGHTAMRLGHTRCDSCYLSRLQADASKQGMKHIGHRKKGNHEYLLPCGCSKILNPYAVKMGIWDCRKHGHTHFHRENGVYLLRLSYEGFEWLKFGLAKNMKVRIRGYGLRDGTEVEQLFYYSLPTRYDAMDIECALHQEFNKHKLDKYHMKTLMQQGGHTECYPTNLTDRITKRVNDLYEIKQQELKESDG